MASKPEFAERLLRWFDAHGRKSPAVAIHGISASTFGPSETMAALLPPMALSTSVADLEG